MNNITKPQNSLISSIIPLVEDLYDKNDDLDITDPDSLLGAIGTLKQIKDKISQIDSIYWILLNQSRRNQEEI